MASGAPRSGVWGLPRAAYRPECQIGVTSLEAALRRIHTDLTDARVSFALIRGLAVSARTEPRFTRDADLAVSLANDAEAETLIHGLAARGYGIGAALEQQAVGRLATVRLTLSAVSQAPVVDLLFASSGIEPEIVAEADALDLLPNFRIGVATTAHLTAVVESARMTRRVRGSF